MNVPRSIPDINDKSTLPGMLEDFDIRPLWAQRDDLPPGAWNYPSLANDFWRLYQNDAPGGFLIAPEDETALETQEIYLIPPGLTLASRNETQLRQFFIHFDLRTVPLVIFQGLFPGPARLPRVPSFCQSVAELAAQVAAQGCGDFGTQCLIKGVVYEAFGHYLCHLPPSLLERYRQRFAALRPVLPALIAIQEDIGRSMTNAALAGLCSLSEDYFIRRFREAVGLSPIRYVLQRRVAAAAQLLLFTGLGIDQIAEQCGFGDRFYFTRVFTRLAGRSPAAYRQGPRT